MADEIPFEELPAFLQHLLAPDPVLDNPSLSWKAPRPPVTMPPAEPRETVRPAPSPSPAKATAPRVPSAVPKVSRPMPSADPRKGRVPSA